MVALGGRCLTDTVGWPDASRQPTAEGFHASNQRRRSIDSSKEVALMPRCTSAHRRAGLITFLTSAVLMFSASAAQAIPLPGTPSEQANTTTPLPPGGDQCSYSPDTIAGIVDFSYSCYGHDLCWQNNSYNGIPQSETSCNQIFLENMRRECDEQNTGFGSSIPEQTCMGAANEYQGAVAGISAVRDVGAPGG